MTGVQRLSVFLREYRGLLLFIALMLVFRSAVADWNDVPSSSMHPSIVEGDRVLVNKLAYDLKLPFAGIGVARLGEPRRGEVIVFNSVAADTRLIKRVVGLPGETVALAHGRLIVNGEVAEYAPQPSPMPGLVAEESIAGMRHRIRYSGAGSGAGDFGPTTVPAGHYLVLGDHRDNSADSRVYGFVPREEIAGRAERVVFSLDYERWLRPRGERFLLPL